MTSLEEVEGCCRSSDIDNNQLKALVEVNLCTKVPEFTEGLGVATGPKKRSLFGGL